MNSVYMRAKKIKHQRVEYFNNPELKLYIKSVKLIYM